MHQPPATLVGTPDPRVVPSGKGGELRERESLDASSARADLHVGIEPPADAENWVRDEDVLDTWFSSWLWPFATMVDSDADTSETLKKFYPTTDLVTGPDIIFFWVARMIMAGYRWQGELPFQNVFFTSIIRDKKGRKMSKQLGNSPDPLDLMAEYGADALRFGLMRIAPTGTDVKFDEDQIVEGRTSRTRSGTRPATGRCRTRPSRPGRSISPRSRSTRSTSSRASTCSRRPPRRLRGLPLQRNRPAPLRVLVEPLLRLVPSNRARATSSRRAIPAARASTLATMDLVLKRFLMLLHPFMPHLTEELWEKIGYGAKDGPAFLMQTPLPSDSVLAGADPALVARAQARVAAVYEAVGRARNLKAEYGLGANKNVKFIIDPEEGSFPESTVFARLAGAGEIVVSPGYEAAKGVPTALTAIGKIHLPPSRASSTSPPERERLGRELAKAATS